MSAHGVRLSDELTKEVARQPHHIRGEFWKAHDHLARLDASGPARSGQLDLPLLDEFTNGRRTQRFGADGWIVYRMVAAACEIEIIEVRWPSEHAHDCHCR